LETTDKIAGGRRKRFDTQLPEKKKQKKFQLVLEKEARAGI
jgi:hypothetical protein